MNPVYKRNEGFRLTFENPVPGTFIILMMQGKSAGANKGTLTIIDMSLKGAKVFSTLQLPTPNTQIKIETTITDQPLSIEGELIWSRKSSTGYTYGVLFDIHSYSEQKLLSELKTYVATNK
ncbi:PilZ domain-containing protein [Cytobacillus suaedae]|nr:PilZ domain-containing protein [Cytobacillus suaedae]